jgi:hypothetical protein
VILLTWINSRWKIRVGYFFTDGLNRSQKHSIVEHCLRLLFEIGVKVLTLSFDGAPSNISMANMLGCQLTINNLKTHFNIDQNTVHVFYDPAHMIKLVRNTLGEKKNLVDHFGKFIDWKYIENLHNLQENEGVHLGNKLRSAHIYRTHY